jgi:hypothetical protein
MWQGFSALGRRVVAMLALVGMLVHAGVPLLHQPRAAASPLDDTLVICSGFGVKVVQIDELHGTADDSKAPQSARIYYCPICLAQQMAATAVLPEAATLPAPTLIGTAPAVAHTAPFAAPSRYSSTRARAPPAIA